MFDINNLGDIETLKDGDQTLILRFDDEGFADLMQCDFSMLMENNTSIWYNGTYAPSGTTTANSYYINTSTGEIYSSTTSTVNDVSTTTWQKNPLMTITGSAGANGVDGKSAYDVAVSNGYTGTVTQWLASLIGANGPDGTRTYFVYSVPTAAISDSRGFCRVGDYAIVTYATTGTSDPQAGQTYVYQGGGTWKGPLTISKATTGPMGPAVTLESSPSITTTEISEGVYQVSLAQNYLALDASSNLDQTITQGSNSIAYSISNNSGARIDLGVSLSGTTNVFSLSSAKTTALMTVNNNGDKAFISPDGSYFDSNKISTDGSGNITAVSYIGNGDTLTVTDPTSSSTNNLKTVLSNIFSPESGFMVIGKINDSTGDKTTGISFWSGTDTTVAANSTISLSPSSFTYDLLSSQNTYKFTMDSDNGYVLTSSSSSYTNMISIYDSSFYSTITDTSNSVISQFHSGNDGLQFQINSPIQVNFHVIDSFQYSYSDTSNNNVSLYLDTTGLSANVTNANQGVSANFSVSESFTWNCQTPKNKGWIQSLDIGFGSLNIQTFSNIVDSSGSTVAYNGGSILIGTNSFLLSSSTSDNKYIEILSYDGTNLTLSGNNFNVNSSGNVACSSVTVSVSEGLTAPTVETGFPSIAINSALKLTSTVNVITTVNSNGAVSLPSVSIGTTVTILNRGENTLLIYPEVNTSNIETLAAGAYQSMVSGGSGSFMKTSSTMWRVI